MRESADLEGIEVGPELGRGSYGRVYKGAALPHALPMLVFVDPAPLLLRSWGTPIGLRVGCLLRAILPLECVSVQDTDRPAVHPS